jgi:hypothetical protein
MTLQLPAKTDDQIVDALTLLLVSDDVTIEEVAAALRCSSVEVRNYLQNQTLVTEAKKRAVEHEWSGRAVKDRARVLLGRAVAQIGTQIEGGELHTASLIRISELLHKVSGLGERSAIDKAQEPTGTPFNINIILNNDKVTKVGGPIIENEQRPEFSFELPFNNTAIEDAKVLRDE